MLGEKESKSMRNQAELCNSNHGERIERNLGGRTRQNRIGEQRTPRWRPTASWHGI